MRKEGESLEDEKMIELLFARSEQAIAALSEKYGAVCRRIAQNILSDPRDAEECLNDVWLAVWNSVPPQRPDPLVAYVCRIARNLAIKKHRANTAKKRNTAYDVSLEELADCFPSAMSVAGEAEANAAARLIDRFLETLEPKSRVMFVRRYWHGDSIAEIAGLFQTGRHAVSVRLSRVRKMLKEYLAKEEMNL